ncbi:hypothetical protein ACH42_07415 [Endozoicomonas sp. (ex Bugula neritina AB1)]|nr:hypothetical protein ACH42_07415 [Endozoicomonas sp. (ex Bugula neritina AB1)]
MSILRWTTAFIISALSFQAFANPLAGANAPSVSAHRMDISDTEFCRKARFDRDNDVQKEPDLIRGSDPVHTDDRAMCFSPDENLFFIANREAQKILGPHAPWYVKISAEFRTRVQEACKIMGFENNEVSRAFDHCLESRFEELMGPYEVRYRREAGSYINKRREVAESLVVRCDAALSIKRSRLPRDIRFPVAYYDPKLSSVPSWLLEERIDDNEWLKRMKNLKVNDIMHDVLGNDCPGNMVYWVTYSDPN